MTKRFDVVRLAEAKKRMIALIRLSPLFFFGGMVAIRTNASWTGFVWALIAYLYAAWLYRRGYVR